MTDQPLSARVKDIIDRAIATACPPAHAPIPDDVKLTPCRLAEEVIVTRDERADTYDASGNVIGWVCEPVRPAGLGWFVKDDSHDRKTTWHRWIVVPI